MSKSIALLRQVSRELQALRAAEGLLGWDQETHMPAKGGGARAESQAALSTVLHQRVTSDDFWALIEKAESEPGLSDREKALVRELRRDAEKARKIPEALASDLARTGSLAQQAWSKARERNAPSEFLPWLGKMIGLKRREAEYLGYPEKPYDALLDQFEPGSRASAVKPVLENLRDGLAPLARRILDTTAGSKIAGGVQTGNIPVDVQRSFNNRLLRDMGFDLEAGRLDQSAHPFTQGLCPGDVRLTTRYREDDWLNAVFSTLHEGGHGLYEQGLPEEEWGTPLAEAVSLSVHESQSRLWENRVGRSAAYWERYLPVAREYFGAALEGVTVQNVLAQVNAVKPSLIRVEADEVTYNLHIVLRFQLEEAIFSGALEVAGIPDTWNEGMEKLLGIRPKSAAEGFMQDVHWSCGLYGYFPTYAMGNLYSAQLQVAMEREMGSLDVKIRAGEFASMREWLREKIHRHGREFSGSELLRRATGEDLNPEYFLKYLEKKYLG